MAMELANSNCFVLNVQYEISNFNGLEIFVFTYLLKLHVQPRSSCKLHYTTNDINMSMEIQMKFFKSDQF